MQGLKTSTDFLDNLALTWLCCIHDNLALTCLSYTPVNLTVLQDSQSGIDCLIFSTIRPWLSYILDNKALPRLWYKPVSLTVLQDRESECFTRQAFWLPYKTVNLALTVYYAQGVKTFTDFLDNVFGPLFEATRSAHTQTAISPTRSAHTQRPISLTHHRQ